MFNRMLRFRKQLAYSVLGMFLLSFGVLKAVETGHQRITSQVDPQLIRTITEDTSVKVETMYRYGANAPTPSRDEGIGELVWEFFDENAISDRIALSADGRWAAVSLSLNDERFEFRSADDGDIVFSKEVDGANGWVAITTDGMISVYAAVDSVWMFRRDGDGVPFFRFGTGNHVAGPVGISRDGRYLVATGYDPNRVTHMAWCFRDGNAEPIWTLEADADEVYNWVGVTVSDDRSVAALNGKFHMYVLDLENGDRIWDEPTYNTESSVSLSADGSILVTGSLSGRLRVFGRDFQEGGYQELWHYSFTGASSSWVTATAVSSDGTTIGAGTLDFFEDHYSGRLALFETYGIGEPVWIAEPLADEVSEIVFSLDGNVLAAVNWGDINQNLPDLVVHEKHSPEPFYELVTPGSLDGLAISDDGSRIFVGGKSVHNRQFGRGGRLYMVEASYPGGIITGTVQNIDDEPIGGAVIIAEDNPYTAITDAQGRYSLRVEVEDARIVTFYARCKGYYDVMAADIGIERGEVVEDINIEMEFTDPPPENLRASQGVLNAITLQWEPYNGMQMSSGYNSGIPVLAADGSIRPAEGLTPWDNLPLKPHRDEADEAENIFIYRSSLPGGPYVQVGTVDGDESRFTDRSHLFPRHRYYYVVTADFVRGESNFSNESVGWIDDNFLEWEADLEDMPQPPDIDGRIDEDEWEGAVVRDISDVFGYDAPDTAGSVSVRIGFNDETDQLYLGFSYYVLDRLLDGMGAGIYIDDDGNGEWTYDRSGSEGNYWAYWINEAPSLIYRSLSGAPYNGAPYYEFDGPEMAFSDRGVFVEFETAIPLGFHGEQEVGLYAPDYTIGLGLFAMYRDQDENPIFNGWWPQNMYSIVSNPYQFARVHVPADLLVPPKAPGDFWIEQEDHEIILSWAPPEFGIDDGELEGLAGFEIYRNGESIAETGSGVQEWVDDTAVEGGWYEYKLRGFVLENGEQFYGPFCDPIGLYAGDEPDFAVMSYDDGSAEAYYVVAFEGEHNQFALRFDFDEFVDTVAVYWIEFIANNARPIRIHMARDDRNQPGEMIGSQYTVTPSPVAQPYRFHFPDILQPRIVIDPDDFNSAWLVLSYLENSPGAPGIGVDQSSINPNINRYYTDNTGWVDFGSGQLMARIAVGRAISDAPPDQSPEIPVEFIVEQNYPNPFNSSSIVPVFLPVSSPVWMDIYDTNGRCAASKFLGIQSQGRTDLLINSIDLNAGVYFLHVRNISEDRIIKITVLK